MTFTIENPDNLPIDLLKIRLVTSARRRIIFYKETAVEKLLSKHLLKENRLTLKAACMRILTNSYIMQNYNGELVIKIQNPRLEKMARFITFGDGKIQGSQILRFAYHQK